MIPRYPGAIVSQSFGTDETFVKDGLIDDRTAHRIYTSAAALGDTVLAPTGDFGASGIGDTSIVASYPASDPLVTAVGGTQGGDPAVGTWPNGLWNNGGYGSEQAWNEASLFPPFPAAGGGAPSQIFPSPVYQSGLGYAKRTIPDVSYNASNAAGVIGFLEGTPQAFGGTSAGTPQWAGIFAIADEQRAAAGYGPLGLANPALYAIYNNPGKYQADFHDITAGDNIFDVAIGGFKAGPGYDLATGIGTPIASSLLADLVAAPGVATTGRAPDVNCQNQQLSGVYRNVTVKKGSWCDLANATVVGDVVADRASGLGITGSTIAGDLRAKGTAAAVDASHPGLNVVCNSVVFGGVEISSSAAASPWSIGGAGCAASQDVTGSIGNAIGNDLRFNGNAAGANEVSNNMVGRNLECNRNGSVSGSANLVGGNASGQCSSSPLPG